MIDSKELRQNNFVMICFTDKEGWEFVQVTDIHKDGTIDTTYKGEERYYYESIPLSTEILLACGFTQDRMYKYRFHNGSIILHYTLVDWQKSDIISNRAWQLALDHGEYLTPKVNNLHNLQNLFYALTRQELNYQP